MEGGVIAYDTLYKTADSRTWYGERTDGDDLDSVDSGWDDVLLRPAPSNSLTSTAQVSTSTARPTHPTCAPSPTSPPSSSKSDTVS